VKDKKLDFRKAYEQHKNRLRSRHSKSRAMELAVGGDFDAVGIIERDLLISRGLAPDSFLVDAGCGSGRLAAALKDYLTGAYVGTDVIADFLDHARQLVPKKNFRFQLVNGFELPIATGTADMICFFSVFTHLLHEQSYAYLREAKRALKPGGTIVFSFLEFATPSHWAVFETNLKGSQAHLNMFMSRDGIESWARHLDFRIDAIIDGDSAEIPISQPVQMDDGRVMSGFAALGQSACVLRAAAAG
jgi:SAM-dependent methyltransferase